MVGADSGICWQNHGRCRTAWELLWVMQSPSMARSCVWRTAMYPQAQGVTHGMSPGRKAWGFGARERCSLSRRLVAGHKEKLKAGQESVRRDELASGSSTRLSLCLTCTHCYSAKFLYRNSCAFLKASSVSRITAGGLLRQRRLRCPRDSTLLSCSSGQLDTGNGESRACRKQGQQQRSAQGLRAWKQARARGWMGLSILTLAQVIICRSFSSISY